MKNSTVNSGNSRSKINSVGVGQPNNRRKSAIVKSMVSPASMPATNPQKIDLVSGRGGETVELPISSFRGHAPTSLAATYARARVWNITSRDRKDSALFARVRE